MGHGPFPGPLTSSTRPPRGPDEGSRLSTIPFTPSHESLGSIVTRSPLRPRLLVSLSSPPFRDT